MLGRSGGIHAWNPSVVINNVGEAHLIPRPELHERCALFPPPYWEVVCLFFKEK